ncbi:MAG: hypothetical protein ABI875_02340 [Gemmatimonadales bacterium]
MPRFERVIGQQPRFSLATPRFRFRALAACAGRAPLGGDREVAMACLVGARMASSMLPPYSIVSTDSHLRSAAARQWLASMSLPPAVRTALAHLADTVASGDKTAAGEALSKLTGAAAHQIDEASAVELRALVTDLAPQPDI